LIEDSYTFGRSPKCEVFIAEEHVDRKIYFAISKYHFKITRVLVENISTVFLEDMSSNGTYVNGILVGRDSRILIANSDEISLAGASNKMYMFIDSKMESWFSQSLRPQYQILKHLGSGGFSDVKLVIHKITCEKVAMKKVQKGRLEGYKIYNETKLLQQFNHPFIIKLENIIDTPEAVYIGLEYMPGGDLMKKIQINQKLQERETKFVMYQLVLALQYLHNQGITHRDVKAENVLIRREIVPGEPYVKITDFGLSKLVDSETNLKTACGTLKYIAPEILSFDFTGPYTNAVDIWSLGVLLFLCLSGKYPFNGSDSHDLKLKILQGSYAMSSSSCQTITEPAICIIRRMLVRCPIQRINIAQMLRHLWFQVFT
ncbi:hypothetical protein AAG570_000140, partial [Ranatra chinensis]